MKKKKIKKGSQNVKNERLEKEASAIKCSNLSR